MHICLANYEVECRFKNQMLNKPMHEYLRTIEFLQAEKAKTNYERGNRFRNFSLPYTANECIA